MNDFDKGFMMGMAMGDDNESSQNNEGCFKTLVSGILIYIGAMILAVIGTLVLIYLTAGH